MLLTPLDKRMSQALEIRDAGNRLRNALQCRDEMNIDDAFVLLNDAKKSLKKLTERYTHLKKLRDDPYYKMTFDFRQTHPEEKGYVMILYNPVDMSFYEVIDRDLEDDDRMWRRNLNNKPPAGYLHFTFWAGDPNMEPSHHR